MEHQVVLSDFSNIDLPTVIYSRGWESLYGIPVTCPFVIIQDFYSNMHRFDYSVPHFVTHVRGTCIIVTPDIVSEVLHIPRVAHFDYPGCNHLRIVSKDELSSLFCETPSSWGDHQNTPYSGFAKDLRFLNMVMTFVLHPLSHYNSITEPCARFLLSLLERLTIDFPSHFIISLIYVYRDTATRDKFIFPSAIMMILHHFSVSYPNSTHFSVMCAIDTATIRRNETQLRPKRPQIETATPLASFDPSTSTPSSSAVMAQLQCMDARRDTLSDELCQVNTRVGRIARLQARLGGFVESPSSSPEASEDEDDDGDSNVNDDDEDEDASSPSDDEMTA